MATVYPDGVEQSYRALDSLLLAFVPIFLDLSDAIYHVTRGPSEVQRTPDVTAK